MEPIMARWSSATAGRRERRASPGRRPCGYQDSWRRRSPATGSRRGREESPPNGHAAGISARSRSRVWRKQAARNVEATVPRLEPTSTNAGLTSMWWNARQSEHPAIEPPVPGRPGPRLARRRRPLDPRPGPARRAGASSSAPRKAIVIPCPPSGSTVPWQSPDDRGCRGVRAWRPGPGRRRRSSSRRPARPSRATSPAPGSGPGIRGPRGRGRLAAPSPSTREARRRGSSTRPRSGRSRRSRPGRGAGRPCPGCSAASGSAARQCRFRPNSRGRDQLRTRVRPVCFTRPSAARRPRP